MSFLVKITNEDGETVDELVCDCLVGALHEEGNAEYQGIFYTDCDRDVAAKTVRAAMQTLAAHLDGGDAPDPHPVD